MISHIYPNYYEKFKCIAQKCKHNCCIGWEIDIDSHTLDFYKSVKTDFKERFDKNIAYENTPHFILKDNDRCPFLNEQNLCDIIIKFSHEHLCTICKEHPRFHNELPKRIESGLGLCCEHACSIILSQKEPTYLCCDIDYETDDEIIIARDNIIALLQNRDKVVSERINDMLAYMNTNLPCRTITDWCNVLLSFEQLDSSWAKELTLVKTHCQNIDTSLFNEHMKHRQHEYEQFVVYLIYRHFANSPDFFEAQSRACFAGFAYKLIYAIGCVKFHLNGDFTFEDQVEIARLFSSEIEYSSENLYNLFDIL